MKLVLLGDPHYPTLDGDDDRGVHLRHELYQTLFECLAAENADAYISMGDLTNSGSTADLKDFISLSGSLNAPFYFVMGNHDTHGCTKEEFVHTSQRERYYAVETQEANLYFIDTTLEGRVDDWLGIMDDAQYQWLQKSVAASKKPVFIISHHPVENTTRRSDERKLYLHENMWQILSQRASGIYINGHNHYHSIVEQNGWLFLQTGDLLSHLDYRVIDFDGEMASVTTKSLKDKLVGADELAPKMKRYTRYVNLTYDKKDLECEFSLNDKGACIS
ncbi:MAG: metallophosphoesterase [Angelakisella sp.]